MATVKELTYRLEALTSALPGLRNRAEEARRADSLARQAVTQNENDTREVLRQLGELCDPDAERRRSAGITIRAGDQR